MMRFKIVIMTMPVLATERFVGAGLEFSFYGSGSGLRVLEMGFSLRKDEFRRGRVYGFCCKGLGINPNPQRRTPSPTKA